MFGAVCRVVCDQTHFFLFTHRPPAPMPKPNPESHLSTSSRLTYSCMEPQSQPQPQPHRHPFTSSPRQDDVPPFPDAVAFAMMEEQLGRRLEEVFSSISERPVAAASLGQVRG